MNDRVASGRLPSRDHPHSPRLPPHWLVGTGFVLPALAHGDIESARMLVRDLAKNIGEQRLPENLNAAGEGAGASGFLMAMAMPTLAIECVLEGKPWPDYF